MYIYERYSNWSLDLILYFCVTYLRVGVKLLKLVILYVKKNLLVSIESNYDVVDISDLL